ncbi:hypothetical protein C8R46DRAFT_1027705 [Mycena filopes]|nr:hypothetical protein C8R46DRAFT_1027705 [Mycena filopes]
MASPQEHAISGHPTAIALTSVNYINTVLDHVRDTTTEWSDQVYGAVIAILDKYRIDLRGVADEIRSQSFRARFPGTERAELRARASALLTSASRAVEWAECRKWQALLSDKLSQKVEMVTLHVANPGAIAVEVKLRPASPRQALQINDLESQSTPPPATRLKPQERKSCPQPQEFPGCHILPSPPSLMRPPTRSARLTDICAEWDCKNDSEHKHPLDWGQSFFGVIGIISLDRPPPVLQHRVNRHNRITFDN